MLAQSSSSLAAHYQQQIAASRPFVHSESGDVRLIKPFPDTPVADHHAALAGLVRSGVLSDYRYIESKPQPAILAITA
jgi:hypothetical protein